MNNHRLFLSVILILIIIYLPSSSSECDGHSNDDEISFDSKVHQSPFILIGTTVNKNNDFDIPNLFNVTFLVHCILKGRPTQRIIHIVQAGSLLGRRSCQRLNVNQEYIVFLEPFFDGTYRPVDLEEIPYNNDVDMLLAKTCGLSRTYPFSVSNDTSAVLTSKCPSGVSVDCPSETLKPSAVSSTTMNSVMFGKSTIDFAALSLLLAEHQHQNQSLAFLQNQNQNHKSLFSDDDIRRNQANQLSVMIMTSFIQFILCNILRRFL